ncbi:putative LNK family protein [Helianthus annuus]|nr:putative LNK family protein [Helianthus annuus]KAJ0541574.1 putative LNK family protein [Helianthus annuus]KAJ0706648.1 putative LNK family protein [Helianthus annuus]
MADLPIYELEDIIWDDFERGDDRITPHPTEDHGSEDKCEGDSCKKPRLEVTPLQSNEGSHNASSSVCNQDKKSKTLNKEPDTMEKDSWSHIPDRVFTASGDADSAKDALSVVQSGDTTKVSNYSFKGSNTGSGSELCTDEGMLRDTSGAVDRNSYNDLNLFSNDGGDKGSNDLLYFGWPDIGNLEDVDRFLSTCDSSYGLGITANDDELVWLTSEDPGGGYEEALKTDIKFPCSEPSALTNVSQVHEPRESDNTIEGTKEQSRQPNHTDGTKAGHWLESYGLKSNDIHTSSSDISDKPFTPIHNWQQTKYSTHGSVGYMQSSVYVHPGYDHVPMHSTGGSNRSMESSSQPLFIGNHNPSGMMLLASGNDAVPSQKQFQMSKNKIECQSDMEGASAALDVPEGSSISSELDEISTTFLQLQQVMLPLDVRTRLCIRDSLYRLARSAEQRHNYAGISDSTRGGTFGPLMTEGTSKYTGLMVMETDTNPIDRTIAHLLFHRPSDSSNMPTPSPLKQFTKVDGSMAGPPMVAEKPSCQQTTNESNILCKIIKVGGSNMDSKDRKKTNVPNLLHVNVEVLVVVVSSSHGGPVLTCNSSIYVHMVLCFMLVYFGIAVFICSGFPG